MTKKIANLMILRSFFFFFNTVAIYFNNLTSSILGSPLSRRDDEISEEKTISATGLLAEGHQRRVTRRIELLW